MSADDRSLQALGMPQPEGAGEGVVGGFSEDDYKRLLTGTSVALAAAIADFCYKTNLCYIPSDDTGLILYRSGRTPATI